MNSKVVAVKRKSRRRFRTMSESVATTQVIVELLTTYKSNNKTSNLFRIGRMSMQVDVTVILGLGRFCCNVNLIFYYHRCWIPAQQTKAEEEAADPAVVAELQREVEDLKLRLHMAAEHYKDKYKECQRLQKQVQRLLEQQGVGVACWANALLLLDCTRGHVFVWWRHTMGSRVDGCRVLEWLCLMRYSSHWRQWLKGCWFKSRSKPTWWAILWAYVASKQCKWMSGCPLQVLISQWGN